MIRTDDLFEEIKAIEDVIKNDTTLTTFERTQLKALSLNCKLLHNLRTNSVLVMRKLGIDNVNRPRPPQRTSNVDVTTKTQG